MTSNISAIIKRYLANVAYRPSALQKYYRTSLTLEREIDSERVPPGDYPERR